MSGTIMGTPDLRDAMSSPITIGHVTTTALSVSAACSPCSSSGAGSFVVHRVGLRRRKGTEKSFVTVSPPLGGGADQVSDFSHSQFDMAFLFFLLHPHIIQTSALH